MVTKREVANAQQALNDAVGSWYSSQAFLYGDSGPDPQRVFDYDLYRAFGHWNRLRNDLSGKGPAVARSTSIAAANENLMLKESVRRTILQMVVAHYNHFGVGMTSDAIQARLRGEHQSISARVSDLVNKHELLRDSGVKKPTRSGSKAIVWEPTPSAMALVLTSVTGRGPGA